MTVQPPSAGRITLDKGPIELRKGSSVWLLKDGEPLAAPVRLSLGWESAAKGPALDLDASCFAFDVQRERIETAWFLRRSVFGNAIAHTASGDETYSASISVRLTDLPKEVCGLVFTLNSFSGRPLSGIQNISCRLLNIDSNEELVSFKIPKTEPRTGLGVCKMVRLLSGEWVMTALTDYADAKTVRTMAKPAAAML